MPAIRRMCHEQEGRTRFGLIAVLGAILVLAVVVYFYLFRAPRTRGELCGTYVLDCQLVKEQLLLRPDGTFTQTAIIKATSERISSKGTWTYGTYPKTGWVFVTLDRFVALLKWPDELYPLDHARSHPGIAELPAEYWFGRLILGGRVDDWPDWKKVK